jgi:hypothetical protein
MLGLKLPNGADRLFGPIDARRSGGVSKLPSIAGLALPSRSARALPPRPIDARSVSHGLQSQTGLKSCEGMLVLFRRPLLFAGRSLLSRRHNKSKLFGERWHVVELPV